MPVMTSLFSPVRRRLKKRQCAMTSADFKVCFLFPTFLPLTHHIQCCLGEEMLRFVLLRRSVFPPVIASCICPHCCRTWLRADVMTKSIYRPSDVGASFPQLHQSFTKSGKLRKSLEERHHEASFLVTTRTFHHRVAFKDKLHRHADALTHA